VVDGKAIGCTGFTDSVGASGVCHVNLTGAYHHWYATASAPGYVSGTSSTYFFVIPYP